MQKLISISLAVGLLLLSACSPSGVKPSEDKKPLFESAEVVHTYTVTSSHPVTLTFDASPLSITEGDIFFNGEDQKTKSLLKEVKHIGTKTYEIKVHKTIGGMITTIHIGIADIDYVSDNNRPFTLRYEWKEYINGKETKSDAQVTNDKVKIYSTELL